MAIQTENTEKFIEGYVTDVTYTMNYKSELNPLLVQFNFLCAGLRPPIIDTACELGFGQGLSINFHSAGSDVKWHGNDFNHQHYLFADELTKAGQLNCVLTPQSFREFCQKTDLPDFDYICLHGVWSWINSENREIIVEFIKRKLRPNGVAYISYNALPGMMDALPLKKILSDYSASLDDKINTLEKISLSIEFLDRFIKLNPEILKSFPNLSKKLEHLKIQPKHYLAHEYFNKNWMPFYFSEMKDQLSNADLKYAAPVYVIDLFKNLFLTDEQYKFIENIPNHNDKESLVDKLVNKQFRADYWVKNIEYLDQDEYEDLMSQCSIILINNIDQIDFKFDTYTGVVDINEEDSKRILNILSDYKIHSIGEISKRLRNHNETMNNIATIIALLVYKKDVALVHNKIPQETRNKAKNLNMFIIARSIISEDINYLFSPLTGGGVFINNLEQIYLVARERGLSSPEEWVKFAWDVHLWRAGNILDDKRGTTFPKDKEGEEMIEHAVNWNKYRLPILKSLEVTF